MDKNNYYTVKDICRITKFTDNAIYEWITRGKILAIKIKNKFYFEKNRNNSFIFKLRKRSRKQINCEISNRRIEMISNYEGMKTKSKFKCLIKDCNHEWLSMPDNIVHGKGCPKCSKNENLSSNIIDMRLSKIPITRVGKYINAKTKIELKCEKCYKHWHAIIHSIFRGQGCPFCSKGKLEKRIESLIRDNFLGVLPYKKKFIINKHRRYPDIIIERKNKKDIIIEINGIQHYEPVCFGGITKKQAYLNFKRQIKRDKDLFDYFKITNNPLIFIKYDMSDDEILKKISIFY